VLIESKVCSVIRQGDLDQCTCFLVNFHFIPGKVSGRS
jgi:hypothetical protein